MNKKIICIGGTGRSGSTLLDLTLANDPKAMSLGEIRAVFLPTKKHHKGEIEALKKSKIWGPIIKGGKKNLYSNLIKQFPEIDIFVDSSKDPFWYESHIRKKNSGYTINNVLIYKSPTELANSYIKRGLDLEWVKFYENYHKRYFGLIDNFVSISYKDFVSDDNYLMRLCNILDIKYFENKKNYWEKEQMMLFGSNTVKSENSHKASNQISNQERRNIKYDGINEKYVDFINNILKENPTISLIEKILKKKDVFLTEKFYDTKKHGFKKTFLLFTYFKINLKNRYRYFFPKEIFKKT